MRHILNFLMPLILFVGAAAGAQSGSITRRSFLKGACALVLSSSAKGSESKLIKYWRLSPEADTKTLGLETFGEALAQILIAENAADAATALRIQWQVQEAIWSKIVGRSEIFELTFPISIKIPSNRYLNLRGKFLVTPLKVPQGPRTVESIELLSSDLGEISYSIDLTPYADLVFENHTP